MAQVEINSPHIDQQPVRRVGIWERWKMRRALQDVSDRLSRLEVRVAVTNRAVAQIAVQGRTGTFQPQTRPTGYTLKTQAVLEDMYGPNWTTLARGFGED